MQREKCDILVSGAGPAGLIAATAFARQGFDVILIDPNTNLLEQSQSDLRSTAFLMPSIRFFEDIGIWGLLSQHSAPLEIMRIIDAGGVQNEFREQVDFKASDIGEPAFGYNISNQNMKKTLLEIMHASPHLSLREGVGASSLVPRSREAIVTLTDGSQIEAKLVIAADGRNSTLRESRSLGVKQISYGQKAVVFTVTHEKPHENISTEIHRSGGPFTLVPLMNPYQSAVVWMEKAGKAEELNQIDEASFLSALNERSCGVLGTLQLSSARKIWPIIAQLADRLYDARLALIAEAAHVVPPIGAQGLNMSLSDISTLYNLVLKARDQGHFISSPELLAQYHRKRWPDLKLRVTGIDMLNKASMSENQSIKDLRLNALKSIFNVKPIRHAAMKGGLGL